MEAAIQLEVFCQWAKVTHCVPYLQPAPPPHQLGSGASGAATSSSSGGEGSSGSEADALLQLLRAMCDSGADMALLDWELVRFAYPSLLPTMLASKRANRAAGAAAAPAAAHDTCKGGGRDQDKPRPGTSGAGSSSGKVMEGTAKGRSTGTKGSDSSRGQGDDAGSSKGQGDDAGSSKSQGGSAPDVNAPYEVLGQLMADPLVIDMLRKAGDRVLLDELENKAAGDAGGGGAAAAAGGTTDQAGRVYGLPDRQALHNLLKSKTQRELVRRIKAAKQGGQKQQEGGPAADGDAGSMGTDVAKGQGWLTQGDQDQQQDQHQHQHQQAGQASKEQAAGASASTSSDDDLQDDGHHEDICSQVLDFVCLPTFDAGSEEWKELAPKLPALQSRRADKEAAKCEGYSSRRDRCSYSLGVMALRRFADKYNMATKAKEGTQPDSFDGQQAAQQGQAQPAGEGKAAAGGGDSANRGKQQAAGGAAAGKGRNRKPAAEAGDKAAVASSSKGRAARKRAGGSEAGQDGAKKRARKTTAGELLAVHASSPRQSSAVS
jgi:hypothetical protein